MNQENFKIPIEIVFIGPPASGKGTTAEYFREKHNIIPISPGNIFRNLLNKNTTLSELIIETTKDGGLCPDYLTNQIVNEEIKKNFNNNLKISLDGYPRTKEQLEFLLENFQVKLFVQSNANYEILKQSALNRRFCKKCNKTISIKLPNSHCEFGKDNKTQICKEFWEKRSDDNLSIFEQRFYNYEKYTLPVFDIIKSFANYVKIDLFDLNSYKELEKQLELKSA